MNHLPQTVVEKKVKDNTAYYTIRWSPLTRIDKYQIQKTVPAMAGIYELFFRGKDHKLHLYHSGVAWLGGLRAVIREMTDPSLLKDRPDLQRVLNEHECYYRFTVCESKEDLRDLIGFFSKTKGGPEPSASGRYRNVRLKELS